MELVGDEIFFELNEWSEDFHPNREPYLSWVSISKSRNWYCELRDGGWAKANGLVVVESNVDMSVNWCVTARFLRFPEDDEAVPVGQFGCPFLPWSEENVGLHDATELLGDDGRWKYEIGEKPPYGG